MAAPKKKMLTLEQKQAILINEIKDPKWYTDIKRAYNELENANSREDFDQKASNFEAKLKSIKERRNELMGKCKELGMEIPNELIHMFDADIKSPKFGIFESRKYKMLSELATPEYIAKLRTKEIASTFETDVDFFNTEKWKEFIDTKEQEYNSLNEQGLYDKSFDEYLRETSISTLELQKFGKENEHDKFEKELSVKVLDQRLKNVLNGDDAKQILNNTLKFSDDLTK